MNTQKTISNSPVLQSRFFANRAVAFAGVMIVAAGVVGCSSNPHKAKSIETKMERSQSLSGEEKVGVKDGNLIVQKKVEMNEELRRIQNEVYSLEDRVYGSRKYKSQGLYGTLKACRAKASSKALGGDGKMTFTEPIDRITDKEDEWEVGVDEEDKIVGVSEEFLKDRITRFKKYNALLQKREDEYQEKLEICDTEVAAKEHDLAQKKKSAQAGKMKKSATAVPVDDADSAASGDDASDSDAE
jgi:hypothetical protein